MTPKLPQVEEFTRRLLATRADGLDEITHVRVYKARAYEFRALYTGAIVDNRLQIKVVD